MLQSSPSKPFVLYLYIYTCTHARSLPQHLSFAGHEVTPCSKPHLTVPGFMAEGTGESDFSKVT